MVGLMISSYLVVNQRKIKVPDLFVGNSNSIYWYTYGVNWRAVVAVCLSSSPNINETRLLTSCVVDLWSCSFITWLHCIRKSQHFSPHWTDTFVLHLFLDWAVDQRRCICGS